MNKFLRGLILTAYLGSCHLIADHHIGMDHKDTYDLPDQKMKNTKLSFDEISGYEDYKIVASHFRKDMNEIRYILANDIAFKA